MDVRVGLRWRLSAEELMLLNCGVGEDSWESLGLQGDPPVHSEGDQPWDFFGRNDAKAEAPILWPPHAKSLLIGKDYDAGRDWGRRRRGRPRMRWLYGITDLIDVSQVNSGRCWWTGRPGLLRFMGSQRVGHNWVPEPFWTELNRNEHDTHENYMTKAIKIS